MYPPGGNHYDVAIDGVLSSEGLLEITAPDGRSPSAPIHTRRQIRGKIAGEVTKVTLEADRLRRVWPDEPNVGWSLPEMALRVDGNLRIGGPTLKTYILNDLPMTSRVRESLVTMNDTYRKLQASEDQLEQADMLNAVGAWKSEDTSAAAELLDIAETQLASDARTYSAPRLDTLSILRRGVYMIGFTAACTPAAGSLTITLTVGSTTFDWSGTGLPTTMTVSHSVPYVKANDTAESVTLTLATGTSIGGSGSSASYFQIAKLR